MEHPSIKIIKGQKPILISAPHAVPIKRKNKEGGEHLKLKEGRVAEIVQKISKDMKTWGVFTDYDTCLEDWDEHVLEIYKKKIKSIIDSNGILLFIDIHGSRASRPFLVDYDFMLKKDHPGDLLLEKLINEHFSKHFHKKYISNGFFRDINGPGNKTLTYFVRTTCSIPAVQLELNQKVRNDEEYFSKLMDGLKNIIKKYEDSTSGIQ